MGSKAARAMRWSVRVLLLPASISRPGPLPIGGMVAETARARVRGKESTAQKRIFVGSAECSVLLVTSQSNPLLMFFPFDINGYLEGDLYPFRVANIIAV
jgi:hypothetical protein